MKNPNSLLKLAIYKIEDISGKILTILSFYIAINTFKPFHIGILYTDGQNPDEMRHDACILRVR